MVIMVVQQTFNEPWRRVSLKLTRLKHQGPSLTYMGMAFAEARGRHTESGTLSH